LPESVPMERKHLARTMKTRVARVLHDSMTATVLPTMSTPYNNEDRRFALRMSLHLPIVVSGRAEDGSAWSEPTETDDISTSGTLFPPQSRSQPRRTPLPARSPS
ncbi:MAG: hypothetical protein LC770_06915, partial [Acidobacteria bacterium]|nr:hypothetical protein [Acidobacteriota bacterium]